MLALTLLLFAAMVDPKHNDEARVAPDSGQVLVTGRISSYRLVRDSSTASRVVVPTYRVTLKDLYRIEGSEKVPRELKIEIRTSHIDRAKSERIFVVLERQQKQWRVLYWENVAPLGCVPRELVPKGYEDYYFDPPPGDDGMKCTFLRPR